MMHEQHVLDLRHLTVQAVTQTGIYNHLLLLVTIYAQMGIGEIHLLMHAMVVKQKLLNAMMTLTTMRLSAMQVFSCYHLRLLELLIDLLITIGTIH